MSYQITFKHADEVLDRCLAKAEADFHRHHTGGWGVDREQSSLGTAVGGTLALCTDPGLGATDASHA